METAPADSQLWLVFTWYSIRRDADPERMTHGALTRLCEDCGLLGRGPGHVSRHDVESIYAKKRGSSVDKSRAPDTASSRGERRGLTYREFALVLAQFAEQIYGSEAGKESFDRLLLERIFPLAKKRSPVDIKPVATVAAEVREWLDDQLKGLFTFYASSKSMTWTDVCRFSRDVGLHRSFSKPEIADAYLASSIRTGDKEPTCLSFNGLWEFLFRLSLSMDDRSMGQQRPSLVRVKALFLMIYRQLVQIDASNSYGSYTTKHLRSDLLVRLNSFKIKFKLLWERDDYVDYLSCTSSSSTSTQPRLFERILDAPSPSPRGDDDIDSRHRASATLQARQNCEEGSRIEILPDVPDIGDPRFNVDDLQCLIDCRPVIGKMLQVTIASTVIPEAIASPITRVT